MAVARLTLNSWRNTAPTIHLTELQFDEKKKNYFFCILGPKLRYGFKILKLEVPGGHKPSLPLPR